MATILDSLVGSCINKLRGVIEDEAVLILGVKEELIELQRRMNQIRSFLNDAERRSIEESAVNNWLCQLRDAVYDADDIIDLARSKGSKLLPDHLPTLSSKSNICSGHSLYYCFSNMRTRHEIAVKIRSLNKRIDNISRDKVFLSLTNTQPTRTVFAPRLRRSSNLVEPNLVGKEVIHACRKVIDLVLAHKENKSYKVAIVGTGGVGKTTLAQKIYNDQKIKGFFNTKAWVCVSKDYSEVAILQQILRKIEVKYMQDESIEELQSKLEQAIKRKSFFLVLDDVWKSDPWINLLRIPLYASTTGTILLTTRLDTVAAEIGVDHIHRVDLMPMDVGWELLWKSMDINEEKEVQHLRELGTDIVHRCGCLPLAIKVIARVLAGKDQAENEWKKILRKDAWSMSNLPSEITGALYLSYEELPHHLKQCFVYSAIYPEDSVISRDDIVWRWVAEGFIEEQDGQLLEDTAEEYYYELIYQNLFQPDYLFADLSRCRVHDLLRQLACYLSREECFVGDPESVGSNIMSKFRRISVVTLKETVVLPGMDKEKYNVRTWKASYGKPLRVDSAIFRRLPFIRVLDLTGSLIQSVPPCIGRLIHLRLLNLHGTDISCLPESICCLINLQILNLQRCGALHSLPLGITKLCNLRHLGLEDTPINQVPKGIGQLIFINDLEGFPIGGGCDNNTKMQDGWKLEELDSLWQLRKLDMVKLERAGPCSKNSLLTEKNYLKKLNLHCTKHTNEPYFEEDVTNIERIFEQLVPPHNLEELNIFGFFGRKYPSWLGATTCLSSVKYLQLIDCKSFVYLPAIGKLPNLKYLKIKGATAITKIGPEFIGYGIGDMRSTEVPAFPRLETLVIREMPNWEQWTLFVEAEEEATTAGPEGGEDRVSAQQIEAQPTPSIQLLPRLKQLYLERCPKLKDLPCQLGQNATRLKEVQLRDMNSLKVVENIFVSDVLVISDCEQLERVSNLPQVRLLRAQLCPNLRCAERLDKLQELFLTEDMQEVSSLWLPRLQQQCRQLHGEDLDVYNWTWVIE